MLLRVEDLVRDYRLPRPHPFARAPTRRVLHGVNLTLDAGGALGLVGESGSGKSTLARAVLGLDRPQGGRVVLEGHAQAVFQDPYGSLDPRMRVGASVAEPMRGVAGPERRARVAAMLEAVGLPASAAARYPHEFSGGQRQRIAIARALVTRPALVVADEPVSALDVSVQAQVLALMRDLRARFGVAWLFISHDLAVVRIVTDTVAVLYRGRIVERGPSREVFARPLHPYTRALVDAIPRAGGHGRPADAEAATEEEDRGCPYARACPLVMPVCRAEDPALRSWRGRDVACHAVTAASLSAPPGQG